MYTHRETTKCARKLAQARGTRTNNTPHTHDMHMTHLRMVSLTHVSLTLRPPSSGLTWASDLVHEGQRCPGPETANVGKAKCAGASGPVERWNLKLLESSFSACSVPAWINDTARFQVGYVGMRKRACVFDACMCGFTTTLFQSLSCMQFC